MSWDELVHEGTLDALTVVAIFAYVGGYMSGYGPGLIAWLVGLGVALAGGAAAIYYVLPGAETIALHYEEQRELRDGDAP